MYSKWHKAKFIYAQFCLDIKEIQIVRANTLKKQLQYNTTLFSHVFGMRILYL